jgi:hypothetical protein
MNEAPKDSSEVPTAPNGRTLTASVYLKAFATVTIIAPMAMFVLSGVLTGGFVPMMGIGHPSVLIMGLCLYCTGMALWRPSPSRLNMLGVIAGFGFLTWVIYGKLSIGMAETSDELAKLRNLLGWYVLGGAWVLNLILLLPIRRENGSQR